MKVPFNKPLVFGDEIQYIRQALERDKISGDGYFTQECQKLMEQKFNANRVMLTTSCTHALEMAALLVNIKPGDEIICPSYTFVSSINSFVLRGGVPKFVDIREDTLNLDENLIEDAISEKTKAIMPVHYAGVACEMDKINSIAQKNNLFVIEDAAQGVYSKYKDKYLGCIGDIGTYSFHETKNYSCGEGGAIVINDQRFIERAEIIREKGTNRSKFFRGEIDKYTWVDIGSSYLPSDILAAFLYEQLKNMELIKRKRKEIFDFYNENLNSMEDTGKLRLPIIPKDCEPNYHMFYIISKSHGERNSILKDLKKNDIHAVFHYIPLHSSPMGNKFGYKEGDLPITEDISSRLIRLPFYYDISNEEQKYVVNELRKIV